MGQQSEGAVGISAIAAAAGKTGLSFGEVFFRGILANALVCLAVWLATGGRTVVDKVFAIVFPISAFVAAGFEHSVANMYFLSVGVLLNDHAEAKGELGGAQLASLDAWGILRNLAASTLGNIVGGAILVGLVYWFVYLRDADRRGALG